MRPENPSSGWHRRCGHHRNDKIKFAERAAMMVQEMTSSECFALLRQSGFGRLGCARSDQPYVVPIYFAADKDHIYGFSMLGKKIQWMRGNPLVCVEVDEIIGPAQWCSVVAIGRYQELPDEFRWASVRNHAHSLLQERASWWDPAYAASMHPGKPHSAQPIFYRISIDEITGHRSEPDKHELATMSLPLESHRPESWLTRWIRRAIQTATAIC